MIGLHHAPTPHARPRVQAGLAIGKFVKEPFDEEARRNMFGQAAKALAGQK
jgi:GSH-dependent disulfide-bond oxidoreductase